MCIRDSPFSRARRKARYSAVRKAPIGCGLLLWASLSSMTGSALFIYALLALQGGQSWMTIAAAVFFFGMAAVCLYLILLAGRARPPIPAPDGRRLFSGVENLTYDDIAARLLPSMATYFAAMQSPSLVSPSSLPPQLDRLILSLIHI